eukprot:scaffold300900_cov26-Tisochrysis_lutea.AAC.4
MLRLPLTGGEQAQRWGGQRRWLHGLCAVAPARAPREPAPAGFQSLALGASAPPRLRPSPPLLPPIVRAPPTAAPRSCASPARQAKCSSACGFLRRGTPHGRPTNGVTLIEGCGRDATAVPRRAVHAAHLLPL